MQTLQQEEVRNEEFRRFYERLELQQETAQALAYEAVSKNKEFASQLNIIAAAPVSPVGVVNKTDFSSIGGGFLSWIDELVASLEESTQAAWRETLITVDSTALMKEAEIQADVQLGKGPVYLNVTYASPAPQPRPSAPTVDVTLQPQPSAPPAGVALQPQPQPSAPREEDTKQGATQQVSPQPKPGKKEIDVVLPASMAGTVVQPNKNTETQRNTLIVSYLSPRLYAILQEKIKSYSPEERELIIQALPRVMEKIVQLGDQLQLSGNPYSVFNERFIEEDNGFSVTKTFDPK